MSRLLLLAALATLAARAPLAQTCTTSWTASNGGSWDEPTNWDAGVPDGQDTACITLAGTYTVQAGGADRALVGLVLGGTSGVQTLTSAGQIGLGDATVRANGRWEFQDRTPGGGDGLYATGTVAVEGEITVPSGVSFLPTGGTLDVAPGGTFRVSGWASVGGTSALFRIRGTLEGVDCPFPANTGQCLIRAPVEVLGGTLRAVTGYLQLQAGGTMNGATLDAGPVAALVLNYDLVEPYRMTVEGVIQGRPEGTVGMSGLNLFAGPAGATLAVTGTGFQMVGTSFLRSGGGSFTNTGLLLRAATGSNFSGLANVIVRNEGVIEIPASLALYAGSVLRNEPGGVVRATSGGRLAGDGNGTGRFENAGLFILDAPGGSFSFDDGGYGRNSGPYSQMGSEIRVVAGNLDLVGPGSRTLPVGTTLTGVGSIFVPGTFEPEGTVSPGTPEQPLARLIHGWHFYPSQVAGSPRLVIDVDAGGRSDTLYVSSGFGSTGARLAGTLVVRVRPGYVPAIGDAFTIIRTEGTVTGQFGQVVADGAPDGIAFVTEISADQRSLQLRAVAVAPDGPITVSTTRPINGGVRPIFLTGPGASGVSAARLECTTCLDPEAFGTIPATLAHDGALAEARFDLTAPRAFGLYDLVLTRPGLDDARVPITVRPFVSYIRIVPSITRGIGVRPASTGQYNWSGYAVVNSTNADEPAFSFASVGREDRQQVDFALASGNAFDPTVVVFYESRTAPDPAAYALTVARVPAQGSVPLSYGLRVDPSNVLFPEQTRTGPEDLRLPFGENRIFSAFSVQHTSFGRALDAVEAALRNAQSPALQSYLAQVDAVDAGAVRDGVQEALRRLPRYVGSVDALLPFTLQATSTTVATPSGLAAQAESAFRNTLDAVIYRLYADLEYAYHLDLEAAPQPVRDLLAAEYDALASGTLARQASPADNALSNVCRALNNLGATTGPLLASRSGPPPPPTEVDIDSVIQCQIQEGGAPPPPTQVDITSVPAAPTRPGLFGGLGAAAAHVARTLATSGSAASPRRAGSCSPPGGGGGGGGGAAGGSCTPPAAPADPNDKTAETSLLCEFGTVTVDHAEQTRCVRYFVPLAVAADPIVYTIQFENLPQATANAEYVTVVDTLDAALDPGTLEIRATSSDSTFSYTVSGQVVTFRFVGIDLPPNVTEPEGEGFLTYAVRPYGTPATGTVIRNRASIVFDYNPAIATPEVVHEVREAADVSVVIDAPDFYRGGAPVSLDVIVANLQGDPASETTVTIQTGGLTGVTATPSDGTCSGTGPIVCDFGTLDAATFERVTLTTTTAPVGEYTLSATASTTAFDGLAANDVDLRRFGVAAVADVGGPDDLREPTLSLPRPNPVRGVATLRWGLPTVGTVDLRVFDLLGREVAVLADRQPAEAGWHATPWTAEVASGVYVVRLQTEAGGQTVTRTRRLVVIR